MTSATDDRDLAVDEEPTSRICDSLDVARSLLRTVDVAAIPLLARLAALVGPRVSFAIADLVVWRRMATRSGTREFRRLRRAFPHRRDHLRLLARRSAVTTRNRVVVGQAITSRTPTTAPIRRTTRPDDAAAVLDGPGSFVLAMGHFGFELLLPVLDDLLARRAVTIVYASGSDSMRWAWERWARSRSDQLVRSSFVKHGFSVTDQGDRTAFRRVLAGLRQERQAVLVLADADLSADESTRVVRRPFAARPSVAFGTGVARLSRVAQVPILVANPCVDADGLTVVWSQVIGPSSRRDRASDTAVTGCVLDEIERGVGRCPDWYSMRVGGSRWWEPAGERWVGDVLA